MTTDDYILSTVRTALATETTFSVVNVSSAKEPSGDVAVCYPYIALDQLIEQIKYQDRRNEQDNVFSMVVGIAFSFKVKQDTGNTGAGAARRNLIVAKCKKVFRTMQIPAPNVDTTHGDTCKILGCSVVEKGGYFDDKRTDGEFVVSLQVSYQEFVA